MTMPDLDRRFETLRQRVTAVVPPGADEIVRRGRHRQAGRLVVAVVLTLLTIAVGGALAIGRPVAKPAPLTTPTPPWQRPGATRVEVTPRLADGYKMYGINDIDSGTEPKPPWANGSVTVEFVHWTPSQGQVVHSGHSVNVDLVVFADEAAAHAAFLTLQADLPKTNGFDVNSGKPAHPALGDEAAAVTVPKPADGAGEFTGQPLRFIAVRVGTAVLVGWGYPSVSDVDNPVHVAIAWLCPYTPRCQPRPGLPRAVHPTEGGTAWAAMVGMSPVPITNLQGPMVIAAIEPGYRPQLVSLDCDEGSRQGVWTDIRAAQYLVVYFASQEDARAYRHALPFTSFEPVQVRTHCT
jgi:hypothetical protein